MSQTIAGSNHYTGAVPFTGTPYTFSVVIAAPGGQARKYISVGNSGDSNNAVVVGTDVTAAATNRPSLFTTATSGNNQVTAGVAMDITGNYNFICAVAASSSSRAVYLNGSNKGASGSVAAFPTGIDAFVISGRVTDFTSGIAGSIAHMALWLRALSDAEVAYLGTGGNPRAIKGCVSYWKFNGTDLTTVPDDIGTNDLTVVGTVTAGSTNPNFETFMTGTALANLNLTQGTAFAGVNSGFDNVTSPFTVSLCQLNAPTTPTATTQALTNVREVPVAAVTGLVADNYIKIAGNANPARILTVNATALTVLVDKDQTFTSGAAISYYTVNPLTLSGLNTATLAGTPATSGTFNLCFLRAKCNADTTIVADTNIINITIAASGGGGGSAGVMLVAGSYCGGFSGG